MYIIRYSRKKAVQIDVDIEGKNLRNNEKDIEQYLQLQHPSLIKEYLWGWLIVINLIGIPTAIFGYLNNYTKAFLLPVIIIINIWDIYLMIAVSKRQKAYVLFIGMFCTIISLMLMIASFKVVQPLNEFPLDEYIIISVCIYMAILVIGGIYHRIAVMKGYYFNKNGRSNKVGGIIIICSAVGLFSGRIIAKMVTQQIVTVILAVCALLLAYIFELGIHNLYKYYLIRKYVEKH